MLKRHECVFLGCQRQVPWAGHWRHAPGFGFPVHRETNSVAGPHLSTPLRIHMGAAGQSKWWSDLQPPCHTDITESYLCWNVFPSFSCILGWTLCLEIHEGPGVVPVPLLLNPCMPVNNTFPESAGSPPSNRAVVSAAWSKCTRCCTLPAMTAQNIFTLKFMNIKECCCAGNGLLSCRLATTKPHNLFSKHYCVL